MRNQLPLVLTLSLLVLLGCFSCKNNTPTEEELAQEYEAPKESDPMMIQYRDSLDKYFGLLEIDLIRQYKINHESLTDERDFYTFYRNANTLRKTLVKKLNKYAAVKVQNQEPLLPFDWFEELAKGYQVCIVNKGRSYAIHFNYSDLEEHAQSTEGLNDDEFINLLELSYDAKTHINRWTAQTREDSYCSRLGDGKHYDVLMQANLILEQSRVFYKEIHKIQVEVINDILFSPNYCNSSKKATQEIQRIIDDVKFKGKEVELLNIRIEQLQKPKGFNINFNCTTGDCPATAILANQNA